MDGAERLILVAIATLGAACLLWLARGAGRARWLLAALVVYSAAISALVVPGSHSGAAPSSALPERTSSDGYVTSDACRSCHPVEHASWARTFHRTMTQVATAAAILAPIDGTRLEDNGRAFELERRGAAVWATLPDPDLPAIALAPSVRRRVVLTTGSHHYQAFWVDGGPGNELRLFPFVYLLAEQRWVARRDAFLQPPDAPEHAPRWNASCIQCHAVAGRPGHDAQRDVFETRVAELGIACESCHGPGAVHARKHRDPFTRYRQRLSDEPDDSIQNPARLTAERASEVCGQCHAYFVPRDEASWWTSGFAQNFSAGAALAESRLVFDHRQQSDQAPLVEASFESMFWPDGTIRVGGREYNGLLRSACFERGHGKKRLSCLSCHSMHESDPDDQLAVDMKGNDACLGCHADMRQRISEHTHHAPSSSGSLCYGCHMPFTSYALLKAVRSHRIDSPTADAANARPDACSLCHLDRSLAWTQRKLAQWYDKPMAAADDAAEPAASLRWLLAGDAAQRVVVAYAMGRPEAQRAAGTDWQAPFLAQLLDDPYSAVRFVAARSLRSLPGFASFSYDFTATRQARQAAVARATTLWEERRPRVEGRPALLFDAEGGVDRAALTAWLARRDERPVTISE